MARRGAARHTQPECWLQYPPYGARPDGGLGPSTAQHSTAGRQGSLTMGGLRFFCSRGASHIHSPLPPVCFLAPPSVCKQQLLPPRSSPNTLWYAPCYDTVMTHNNTQNTYQALLCPSHHLASWNDAAGALPVLDRAPDAAASLDAHAGIPHRHLSASQCRAHHQLVHVAKVPNTEHLAIHL